ncbi:MAG: lytic murein transglycosylase B [Zoogloeaceae bacterium]|nr:lytic murein transglycosylase B [Rhodocyclaceae bacterium]MCP5234635.1 lytic murein transglycosylase B [Zoogloeaceae bacterium]
MIRHLALLQLSLLCVTTADAGPAGLAAHPAAAAFVARMEAEHGFERESLLAALATATYQDKALRLISPPKPGTGPRVRSWTGYRARFVDPVRIRAGLAFWDAHRASLERAEQRYGVPSEVILGIIGVETVFGRVTGSFPLLDALATLAFDYPPRADLFRRELENLFLLARENGRAVGSYTGSYAGAIGFPQFLPSSVRRYAVDFDGDGRIDLERSEADAIGSVARYLAEHGWRSGERVADPVALPAGADVDALLATGIEPRLDRHSLSAAGIELPQGIELATLVDLESPGKPTEYWLGYRNFYVLTRYNRSSFYAMSVLQLAQALREARISSRQVARGAP